MRSKDVEMCSRGIEKRNRAVDFAVVQTEVWVVPERLMDWEKGFVARHQSLVVVSRCSTLVRIGRK